jgi:hypothetical protein
MPFPILLLERASELERPPVAADFTIQERQQLRIALVSCIAASTENGDVQTVQQLQQAWRDCVAVGEPPGCEISQEMADRWTLLSCVLRRKPVPADVAARNPEFMQTAALRPYLQVFENEQGANDAKPLGALEGEHELDRMPITDRELQQAVIEALGLDEDE